MAFKDLLLIKRLSMTVRYVSSWQHSNSTSKNIMGFKECPYKFCFKCVKASYQAKPCLNCWQLMSKLLNFINAGYAIKSSNVPASQKVCHILSQKADDGCFNIAEKWVTVQETSLICKVLKLLSLYFLFIQVRCIHFRSLRGLKSR